MPDLADPEPTTADFPRALSNAEAARDWATDLTTRSGVTFHVRPATPGDEQKLADFFLHVRQEDLYYRFLTGLFKVDKDRLVAMARDDDPQSIDFLAIDDEGSILATAQLSADDAFGIGEFAMCTRADRKHLGLSWTLLEHLVRYAQAMGIPKIQSIQSWDDRAALQLESEMGFDIHRDPGDSTLMIAEKALAPLDRAA